MSYGGSDFNYRKVYEILKAQAQRKDVVVFAMHPSDVHLLREKVVEYNSDQEVNMFNMPPVSMYSAVPVLDFVGIEVGKGRWYEGWFCALSDLKDVEGFDTWRDFIESKAGWELIKGDDHFLRTASNEEIQNPFLGELYYGGGK